MQQGPSSFADLIGRLNERDAAAAEDIFRRYAQQLVRLASQRIVGSLRRKVDAEDLVQSAFRSFFRAQDEAPFQFEDWANLWAVLATITLRKCGYQVRHFLTAKRNVRLEEASGVNDGSCPTREALSREPTPAEATVLSDLVEHFLSGLEGKTRQIAELALEGHTAPAIATQVGLTERSVFRQMERIKRHLLASLAEKPEDLP
jgi:RNA polymerase sigma-70 factor (ECF subfamily)